MLKRHIRQKQKCIIILKHITKIVELISYPLKSSCLWALVGPHVSFQI